MALIELVLLALIALVVFGGGAGTSKGLPGAGLALGRGVRGFLRGVSGKPVGGDLHGRGAERRFEVDRAGRAGERKTFPQGELPVDAAAQRRDALRDSVETTARTSPRDAASSREKSLVIDVDYTDLGRKK